MLKPRQRVETDRAANTKHPNELGTVISGTLRINGIANCYEVQFANGEIETWHESRLIQKEKVSQ